MRPALQDLWDLGLAPAPDGHRAPNQSHTPSAAPPPSLPQPPARAARRAPPFQTTTPAPPQSLPLSRLKKMIRACEEADVKHVSNESAFLIGRATVSARRRRRSRAPGAPGAPRSGRAATRRAPRAPARAPSLQPRQSNPRNALVTAQELVLEEMVAKAHASMSRDGRKSLLYKDIGAPAAAACRRLPPPARLPLAERRSLPPPRPALAWPGRRSPSLCAPSSRARAANAVECWKPLDIFAGGRGVPRVLHPIRQPQPRSRGASGGRRRGAAAPAARGPPCACLCCGCSRACDGEAL